MLDNTLILFLSDNGANVARDCWDSIGGSNLPYREGKFSSFEGGVKTPAFIWAPWFEGDLKGSRSDALVHVVDIFALFATLGEESSETVTQMFSGSQEHLDAEDHLLQIIEGEHSSRETIIHQLVRGEPDPPVGRVACSYNVSLSGNFAVIRHLNYKLFWGTVEQRCRHGALVQSCPPLFRYKGDTVMLFDIKVDPLETVNIAESNTDILDRLVAIKDKYWETAPTYWTPDFDPHILRKEL